VDIVRYRDGKQAGVGVLRDGTVSAIPGVDSLAGLLTRPLAEIRALLESADGPGRPFTEVEAAAPVDGRTEVWAAGVTYRRSRQARVEESAAAADVYERVYASERPELFFKSVAWRVSGPGEPIAVREDSAITVPEPELAVVLNRHGEIAGYTVCDDVSSRSIEGENPLYLPQAKIYLGGCALGPVIRPAWEVPDPLALPIRLGITRSGRTVWSGEASTAELVRRIEDLVEHLLRAEEFPEGAVLSTGTCLVPDLPFTLLPGDTVTVTIDGIGTLTNPVVRGKSALAAVVEREFGTA
jgi:2-dehydro-3-deoxy-D-arabinonate dehydratase